MATTVVVVVGFVAEVRIVAVIPIFAATVPSATGNLLALGALETLEAKRALRISVAFASARLQVLCSAVVSAAQHDVMAATEFRIVAVVPIFWYLIFTIHAAGNVLAVGALETLQPPCALCIRVALAPTRLEVCGATIVRAAQDVACMATTVVVVVVGEFRTVAVVPISTPALPSATGNVLAVRALEALEALRALRIRVAFASARLQVLCTTAVAAAQHDVMAFTTVVVVVGFVAEFRIVAVVPINTPALPSATGNLLAMRALETLEAKRALRIRVAFAFARL